MSRRQKILDFFTENYPHCQFTLKYSRNIIFHQDALDQQQKILITSKQRIQRSSHTKVCGTDYNCKTNYICVDYQCTYTQTLVESFITKLQKNGIRLVCLDFDQTIISIHTKGHWQGTVDELVDSIRKFFLSFIPMAIKAGLKVAVTTFSSQTDIIYQCLKQAFGKEIADVIPIEGSIKKNKNSHIKKIRKIIAIAELLAMDKSQIILIDDNENNVNAARKKGYNGLYLDPRNPNQFIKNYLSLKK